MRDGQGVRGVASPPTRGTSTSTGPATPTTASTPSTCGTGARTPSQHLGRVIVVGGDAKAVRRLGFSPGQLAGRRARDGDRRRRARRPRSPTCTTRRSSWRTCSDGVLRVLVVVVADGPGARRPFPARRPAVAGLGAAARPRAPGRPRLRPRVVAPLPGAPGPGHGARQRHPARRPACWRRRPSAGSSTCSTSTARSSSPPTTPATSTRRCC